jgi:hypothetical protein
MVAPESGPKKEDDTESGKPPLVDVNELRDADAESTCLRPLGLCDLGACDVCWYRPDHPRFRNE